MSTQLDPCVEETVYRALFAAILLRAVRDALDKNITLSHSAWRWLLSFEAASYAEAIDINSAVLIRFMHWVRQSRERHPV